MRLDRIGTPRKPRTRKPAQWCWEFVVSFLLHGREINLSGWNKARDEFDNRNAAQERAQRLARQAMRVIFDSLDKPVQQFVKTLYDHDHWPTTQKRVTKETKGFFGTKQETQLVTEPDVLSFSSSWENVRFSNTYISRASVRLRIFASGLWDLSSIDYGDWGTVDSVRLVVRRTSNGLEQGSAEVLLYHFMQNPRIDIDHMETNTYLFVRAMAGYLIEKGLPLPSD